MTDSATPDVARSRRSILAAAAGSAAALAATAIRPPSAAAVASPMLTETDNAATAQTGVTNSTAGSQAFYGHAAGNGNGIEGTSVIGHGVRGISTDTSDPETNVSNAGVVGVAGSLGSVSSNIGLTGVYGYADPSSVDGFVGSGVWGDSGDFGVVGTGFIGVLGDGLLGVVGTTADSAGVGVIAESTVQSGLGLQVAGRAEFSRSGRAVIAKGAASKKVTLAGCTASTLVFAVLASNRSGRWVRAVVSAAGSFTIYLNTTVTLATSVTWIAFTNPANHGG